MSDHYKDLPLMATTARQIIEVLFKQKPLWRRSDLATRVLELHKQGGGVPGQQNEVQVVKKALQNLQSDGIVTKAPAKGYWRLASAEGEKIAAELDNVKRSVSEEIAAISDDEDDEAEDAEQSQERVIGSGRESVYVYFNPNDKKLAMLENRSVWECKVGRTGVNDSISRILAQGVRTALSRMPVVGLVIRTDDSSAIEKALHASMRLIDAQVADSPGVEWFLTSPDRIEAWFVLYQQSLASLDGK